MIEKKLSTTEVLALLKVERSTLLHHVHRLRGLLNVSKDSKGRFEFTGAQVEILKRHFRDARRAAQAPPDDDSDDMVRFQERIRQVRGVRRELTTLVNDLGLLLDGLTKTPIASAIIYTLPLPNYQLVKPVRVLLYPYRRHFRASLPEARLQVQEATRENALFALRAALLRAYLELPPSPPLDDPQTADQWRVLHALIVPGSHKETHPCLPSNLQVIAVPPVPISPDRETTHSTDESVRRIADSLATALRLAGIPRRACERRLGLTTGYLTRILAGEVHLRVCVVLDLCRILGLPPAAFFAALFPDPPVSETTARLLGALAAVHPQSNSSPESLQEALHQLREVVRTLEAHLAGSADTAPPPVR